MQGASEEISEPDLTPLLDLVLQLVMFFMLVANFVMEQFDTDVVLPYSAAAKSLDSNETKDAALVYLNITKEGDMKTPENRDNKPVTMKGRTAIEAWMKKEFNYQVNRFKQEKKKDPDLKKDVFCIIIIRAHEETPYVAIDDIIQSCAAVKFTNVQLRAIIDKK